MSSFRLGFCLPSQQTWDADFGLSVANLCLHMQKVQVPGYRGNGLMLFNRRSSLIAKSRQELVQDAIKKRCTHVLFIDSDQYFPGDLCHRLAGHGKRVIGCNIATKAQTKSVPTARARPQPGEWWGGHIIDSRGKTGIEQVWRLGFGVMLIDLEVFKDVPLPWFNQEWKPEFNEFLGEDWFFCELMEKRGVPIWVDHEASMHIGHNGNWTYTLDGCVPPEEKKDAA